MPTLTVDDNGTQIYYIDSGAVEGRTYTTVFIVHGHTFHGGIFRSLFPLAAANDLRLIAINRRDYAGSSLLTTAELVLLGSGSKDDNAVFLRDRGIEILIFLDHFIRENSIPEITTDGSGGGLALLGWSLGVAVSLAAIAAMEDIPLETSQRLGKYFRRNIVFEPPSIALGIVHPPKAYTPLYDSDLPVEQRGHVFAKWVTGYFTHPDPSPDTGNLDTLEYVFYYEGPDPERKPSLLRISPTEISSLMDFQPGQRSEELYFNSHRENLEAQTHKALFNDQVRERWPRMRTVYLLCENSPWMCIHAAWEIMRKSRVQARETRTKPIHLVFVERANHMIHLDDPEKAIQAFVACLSD